MSLPSLQDNLPELWAGTESTVNRVGDTFFDQLERSGHATRLADLDLFADLGVRALRYPILWERTAPHGLDRADWSWADERLGRLRELGIRPIVGLVHHGSGPSGTSLVEPSFAMGLAEFAQAVAERYPWVDAYTPINEPLTTARFSGLYGHWYPHGRDDLTFARAHLTQCRAVVLAMRAIREHNPQAQLIQTDDLGKTFSTPGLAYQAEFENTRRWSTFDLLCGRVDPDHLIWSYLRTAGVEEAALQWFRDNPCPPDIIGINYYLTSERFLDENYARYPTHVQGGNGRDSYADVEAVRVRGAGIAGPHALLREAWDRFHLPIAVTEAHLGCTREEQLRWLKEVWDAARALRRDGVDIRAVTAWSLLGAYDWNSLVTQDAGYYEPGVFDLRSPTPRPTALAHLLRELGAGRDPQHPLLEAPGWWRRPGRLIYGWTADTVAGQQPASPSDPGMAAPVWQRPLLITEGSTTLGDVFARLCEERGIPYRILSRGEMNIAGSVEAVIDGLKPWAVVNTAWRVPLDAAEHDPAACYRVNTLAPVELAAACARHGAMLLTFSSDLVFDGAQDVPYVESDKVAPLSVYGHSQAEAESRVLERLPSALVVRTNAAFSPWDQQNFVAHALRELSAGRSIVAPDDTVVSPTYLPDLAHACLDLLIDGGDGLWHLANQGAITWADLARSAATLAGVDPKGVEGRPVEALDLPAKRPPYSVLGSERGLLLPTLDQALARYVGEIR
jgi:dTDP-4-dehydrorhamnose reductase